MLFICGFTYFISDHYYFFTKLDALSSQSDGTGTTSEQLWTTLKRAFNNMVCASFSHSGKHLISSYRIDQILRIWQTVTRQ